MDDKPVRLPHTASYHKCRYTHFLIPSLSCTYAPFTSGSDGRKTYEDPDIVLASAVDVNIDEKVDSSSYLHTHDEKKTDAKHGNRNGYNPPPLRFYSISTAVLLLSTKDHIDLQ